MPVTALRTRRAQGDDGIVIVFFALILVVLLIFGAFAIDLGSVYNARRQDQSAVNRDATTGTSKRLVRATSAPHGTLWPWLP